MKTLINTNKVSKQIFYGMVSCLCVLGSIAHAADGSDQPPVKVHISGAPEELAENLKAFLPSLRNLKCDSTPRRVERFIDASSEKLLEGAEAMGYFDAQFKMTSRKKGQCWVLDVATTPGKTVKVNKLAIRLEGPGKKLKEFQTIIKNPPYQTGDVLISQYYEDFKTRLKRTANSLGFFDADLTRHTIKVDIRSHLADIDLLFDTGERYRFGKITVDQDILGFKYIDRYTLIKEGEVFRSEQLIKQQRLLEKSRYYKLVQVQAGYDQASKHTIPIHIKANRRKRYTYKGALGFATDEGMYVEASMDTHWLNKKGHQLNLTTRISEKDPSVGMKYKIPLWKPEYEFATLSASWNRSDNDDIKGTALKLGLDYHRRNKSDWKQVASLNYLDEETQIDGEESNHSQLTLFGLSVKKTERDNALFPTKGWRLKAGLKGATQGFLSDQSVLQFESNAKYLHTFGSNSVGTKGKAILQAGIGSTFVGNFDEMPKSLRFFAGGQNSVRGYGFEELGEKNSNNEVIGGKHLLTFSTEYEYPIKDKFSAAAFVDTGNAFNSWNDYTIEVGYGLGLRYKSPLGPIRIDFAVPENDNTDIHFYFSLGPDL